MIYKMICRKVNRFSGHHFDTSDFRFFKIIVLLILILFGKTEKKTYFCNY